MKTSRRHAVVKTGLTLAACVSTSVGLSSGLVGDVSRPCQVTAPPVAGLVAALLAEGRLVVFDVATGGMTAAYAAGNAPRYTLTQGRIATTPSSGVAYAIVPDGTAGFVLAAFDAASMAGRTIGTVPADQYAGLAVGSQTGRVFAFGSIDATVLALDPKTAGVTARYTAGNGCQSIAGAVSTDERRIYVAYHGACSGVEVFDVTDTGWRRAHWVASHGSVRMVGEHLFAANGGSDTVLQVDRAGQVVRTIDSRLNGSHLMELAVDRGGTVAFFAGSCGYSGGFSRITLPANGAATLLVPPGNSTICGERIAAAPDGAWVAIAPWRLPEGVSASRRGSVLIVDAKTGALLREIPTTSEVVDVAALR